MPGNHHRGIRSYVIREGRMTSGQQRALTELWPRFGIELTGQPVDFSNLFGRTAALTLEIGFGNGENLAAMAAQDPAADFIGIEVHRPGVGHLLRLVQGQSLSNIRVFNEDAVAVLERSIPASSFDRVLLLFPDPWPKKRHHKRRLVQREFVDLLHSKMKGGAVLHIATDWEPYAIHIAEVIAAAPGFEPGQTAGKRESTKFEKRGRKLGHEVYDLIYTKRKAG
ncbi:MAG: tRNA (guanosine(46)-N7)-methyltransferase TrmB [Gammaproteobacteria bacterium]